MANLYVFHQRSAINNAVWHGDSLTYGENGSNPGTTAATRLAVVLNALGPTWQGTNYGNPGHTITQMISELGSYVDGLYDPAKQNNYLIAQGGHNDIVQGADAATVISRIQSYCSAALAANPWKIIWSTEPPAGDPGIYPSNFDSVRDTVNSYVRQNWRSLGIAAVSDFALDFQMGLDGCEYNSIYYGNSDFTHPTDAGYTIWGNFDLGAVVSLYGSSSDAATSSGRGPPLPGTQGLADCGKNPKQVDEVPANTTGVIPAKAAPGLRRLRTIASEARGQPYRGLMDSGSPLRVGRNDRASSPEDCFRTLSGDGQLCYSVFDGTSWSADRQIQPLGMSGSPSAVLWKAGITVFHQGANNNGQLWYSYGDGATWGEDTLVQNVAMSEAPSAVVYNGKLYVFHQGPGDGHLWYSVFDGTSWSTDSQIQPLGMSGSPSAVVWKGGITVFHQGANNNGQLLYTYSPNGINWGPDTPVQTLGMSESPSAVVYNGNLYVFHQGGVNNGELWYTVFDGTNWTADRQIQPLGMSGSPLAVAWVGGITVLHQGANNNGQLLYTYSPNGINWGGDTLVQNLGLTDSPSAVVF